MSESLLWWMVLGPIWVAAFGILWGAFTEAADIPTGRFGRHWMGWFRASFFGSLALSTVSLAILISGFHGLHEREATMTARVEQRLLTCGREQIDDREELAAFLSELRKHYPIPAVERQKYTIPHRWHRDSKH